MSVGSSRLALSQHHDYTPHKGRRALAQSSEVKRHSGKVRRCSFRFRRLLEVNARKRDALSARGAGGHLPVEWRMGLSMGVLGHTLHAGGSTSECVCAVLLLAFGALFGAIAGGGPLRDCPSTVAHRWWSVVSGPSWLFVCPIGSKPKAPRRLRSSGA